MASETSSVSSPSVVPSRTEPSPFPHPTVFSNSKLLQPRVNQISGCCANKVIINLSTALVIPDYSLYYKGPIESFQPTFYALNDGSLVAPPFVNDLSGANLSLLVIGMLTMLFVRNIIVSGDYIRRVKVKRKILFYVLFLSQMLAPVSLIPVIMSSFNQTLDCTVITILSCVTGTVSLALLITGILGVKAYKCLNNSRIILIILALFQLSSSAVVAIDASTTRGERRLTGSCIRVSDLLFTRIFVWIQLVESLFICCCFLYACWKSRGSSSARGRISIQLSMEDLPIEVPGGTAEQKPTLRGWWDYVPDVKVTPTARPQVPIRPDQPARKLQSKLTGIVGRRTSKSDRVATQSPRPMSSAMNQSKSALLIARGTSPTPSSLSRFGKLVPNIHLFQQVIKDELLYTTFITATCVVVALLAVFGVNFKNGLTVTGWIALNWGIISLLAIHSFGRVIRRHERDALLQHPFTCNAVRAGKTVAEKTSRESQSSTRPPFRREAEGNDTDDPFADTRRLGDSRDPRGSPSVDPPSPNPFDDHSPGESANSDPFADFPASGHSTPLVAHQSLDGSELVEGFSESWLLERGSISSSGDEKRVNMRL